MRLHELLVELAEKPDERAAFEDIFMCGMIRHALLAPCGLPSPDWRGSGLHCPETAGTISDAQLEALERALDGMIDDTWAAWTPDDTTADKPARRKR